MGKKRCRFFIPALHSVLSFFFSYLYLSYLNWGSYFNPLLGSLQVE